MPTLPPSSLDARTLARRLGELAGDERRVQVQFLLHLDEFDRRRAWLELGYGSLWTYCLEVLHLREGSAGRRIGAMKVLRRFPRLAEALGDGRLCLTTLALLGQVLTEENAEEVVARAAFRTTAEVDQRPAQFLYRQADEFVFMDLGSYDQVTLDAEQVGEAAGYLLESLELKTVVFQDRVISLSLPLTVDLRIEETNPAIKGATAQAQLKPARVETGITVMVPSYVEPGERIRVDTRDGRFVERAK